jgi:hypothetical protein
MHSLHIPLQSILAWECRGAVLALVRSIFDMHTSLVPAQVGLADKFLLAVWIRAFVLFLAIDLVCHLVLSVVVSPCEPFVGAYLTAERSAGRVCMPSAARTFLWPGCDSITSCRGGTVAAVFGILSFVVATIVVHWGGFNKPGHRRWTISRAVLKCTIIDSVWDHCKWLLLLRR